MPNKQNAHYSPYGFGMPYPVDLTTGADKALHVIDEPQVLTPGHGGSIIPLSLRSNRVDNYTALLVQASNALCFPRSFSAIIADVAVWMGSWGLFWSLTKWLLPLSGIWWLPWAVYGLVFSSFLAILIMACIHRPVLIPFGVLRCVLIAIAYTLCY